MTPAPPEMTTLSAPAASIIGRSAAIAPSAIARPRKFCARPTNKSDEHDGTSALCEL